MLMKRIILIFISLMWVRETFFPQLTFNDIVENMGIKEKISSTYKVSVWETERACASYFEE